MTTLNKYIGARYVPLHLGVWDNTKEYEPLSVVTFVGSSYTSKTYVPIGANITDEKYWACTGNYNAQVEAYRQEVVNATDKINYYEDVFAKSNSKSATVSYNATPNDGKILKVLHGDNDAPTKDGVTPSVYIQRIDQSLTADSPAYLIPALYTVFKRKLGGTGWLYSNLSYMQDDSNGENAQSVATAGMAYATNSAKVWGLYGDAYTYSATAYATGCEVNAQNFSGVDYEYAENDTLGKPFTAGLWCMSFGNNHNTFGVGIGGLLQAKWGCGIYVAPNSIKDVGIDFQATPPTIIKLHGASDDGQGSTKGGVGIDFGADSFYGQAVGQGVMNIWEHDIAFGPQGLGKIRFNSSNGTLEFWYNGILRGHIDCSGTDHAL